MDVSGFSANLRLLIGEVLGDSQRIAVIIDLEWIDSTHLL